jgi:hypothetical protein
MKKESTREPEADDVVSDLEARLLIDKHALDDECLDQPNRYYRVSEALTLAISQRDQAKQELTEVEARIDAEIREGHDTETDGRLTEKMVESQKSLHREVLKAKAAHGKLHAQVGKLNALKESYHQRRYMLQGLIDLHLGGYFGSSDSVPRSVRDRNADTAKAKHKERYKDSTHERRNARGDND